MTTLRDVIDGHAAEQPEAFFLFAPEPGAGLTYAGLRATARSLAADLAAQGIGPGDVVSYMLPNGGRRRRLLGAMYGATWSRR
jgi:non-ribosomal peptide synthetase component E (peptide arylation enzyme)